MQENEEKSSFSELLTLSNNLRPITVVHKQKPIDRTTTPVQKRRVIALSKRHDKIKYLEETLTTLYLAKRQYFSQGENTSQTPEIFNSRIRKIKRSIAVNKRRIDLYQRGLPGRQKHEWQDGQIYFDSGADNPYLFFRGLITHEITQWKQFCDKEGDLIMDNKNQKKYNDSRLHYYTRLKNLDEKLKPQARIFFLDLEGRWLIRHMQNVADRLERDRVRNYHLPKEHKPLSNADYRQELGIGTHRKKYEDYELDEIHEPRSIQRLMLNFGGQMRDDERDMLIKIALELKAKFQAVFIIAEQKQPTIV